MNRRLGASAPGKAEEQGHAWLAPVTKARFFFAHQSVGVNILDGVADVYRSCGVAPPRFIDVADAGPHDRHLHARVGRNGDPFSKIRGFEAVIRSHLGPRLDVAILKFCYADVHAGTDVEALFAAYRAALRGLEREFPNVAFIPATVPVMIRPGPRGKLNVWLHRDDRLNSVHNVAREKFNSLLRNTCSPPAALFDIASIESTRPGGARVAGTRNGERYYCLARMYAADSGHLNARGASRAAEAMLHTMAARLSDGTR